MKHEEPILESSTTRKLIDYLPYLLLIFSVVGFTVQLVLLQSLAFSLRSSVIFVPAALAGLFLLRKNNGSIQAYSYGRIAEMIRNRISYRHLVLINVLLFLWSIIVLLSFDSRNIIFFLLSSAVACVIVLQIFHADTPRKYYAILLQICALSLALAWSLTLNYSLYFGYTDTLSHMHFISTILGSGHTSELPLTYENFPLFHILISQGVLITGLGIGPALFIIMALAWLVGIGMAFLISSKIFNSTTIGLIVSLLFAISPQIIFYSSYTISRSLAFIFFMLIIYLIFNKNENNRLIFTILSIAMSWVLILTHSVTVFFVIPLLFVVYVIQRLGVGNREQGLGISGTYIVLFSISIMGYLFFASYETTRLLLTYYLSPLTHDAGEINLANIGSDIFIIIRNLFYILSIFFAIIGSWSILKRGRNYRSKEYIIALSSLVFLPLFIPGFLDVIPGSGVLLIYRLPLLVTPFIVITLGYGIFYFVMGNKSLVKASIHPMISLISILAIISICSFFSMTGTIRDSALPWNEGTSSDYFTVEEITAFASFEALGNHSQILHSDDYTIRNLYQLNDYKTRIITSGNISNIANGYLILRSGELESRGVLPFGANDKNLYSYKIDHNDPQTNITLQLIPQDRIYDNGAVQSFVIQR